MKETSIRFRLSFAEKSEVEAWSASSGKPASELIRTAIKASMSTSAIGQREKRACAAARHAANALLDQLASGPVDVDQLRSAALQMRHAARQVLVLS